LSAASFAFSAAVAFWLSKRSLFWFSVTRAYDQLDARLREVAAEAGQEVQPVRLVELDRWVSPGYLLSGT
jgi:hypothetical protein